MDELRKSLTAVAASLQVIGAQAQATATHAQATADEVQKLKGTFASIEQHLVKLFEEEAATQARLSRIEARVDALESKAS